MLIATAQAAETAAAGSAHGGFIAEPETWVSVAFIIVVVLLVRPAWRAITTMLDSRRDAIKARIDEAERLAAEAQELLANAQSKQREAQKEAEAFVARAKADAERQAEQAARDLADLLKRREQQALDRIAQAEADALRQLRNSVVDLAVAAAGRLIGESLGAEKAAALVDQVIADLPKRLN